MDLALRDDHARLKHFVAREARSIEHGTASRLQQLHAVLDAAIVDKRTCGRFCSVAADPAQVAFYSKLAAALPANTSVCETVRCKCTRAVQVHARVCV